MRKLPIDISICIGELDAGGTPATLDSQTSNSGGTTILQGNSSGRYTAQQFIPSQSGTIESIDLRIQKPTSATLTGNFIIAIQGDSSDNPDGVDIGSQTFPVAPLQEPPLLNVDTYTFSSPPSVVGGTKYWIVFRPAFTNSPIEFISAGYETPSIIPELLKNSFNSGSSWSVIDGDLYFVINGLV